MVTATSAEPRSVRKRRAILEAATDAFLRNGYRGTSMDEVAAAAQVSKQTVYKHFADKESLFVEIVIGTVDAAQEPAPQEDDVGESDDLAADLTALARRQLGAALQPRVLALRRLVIAEADRFPELGRAFYERGAGRATASLASTFERLAGRGLLAVDEPDIAALHFNWLIMAAPVNRAMLLGHDAVPAGADLDRLVEHGVAAFLRAYAP
jgi:TetR/AcrR family transcriptional regulator, mexJK operon transcriptional repressor